MNPMLAKTIKTGNLVFSDAFLAGPTWVFNILLFIFMSSCIFFVFKNEKADNKFFLTDDLELPSSDDIS